MLDGLLFLFLGNNSCITVFGRFGWPLEGPVGVICAG